MYKNIVNYWGHFHIIISFFFNASNFVQLSKSIMLYLKILSIVSLLIALIFSNSFLNSNKLSYPFPPYLNQIILRIKLNLILNFFKSVLNFTPLDKII